MADVTVTSLLNLDGTVSNPLPLGTSGVGVNWFAPKVTAAENWKVVPINDESVVIVNVVVLGIDFT